MFTALRAKKPGWILTVTTCPSFGLRPQVDISKSLIKRFGGLEKVKKELNKQALDHKVPMGAIDHEGRFIFKSDNWPKETK